MLGALSALDEPSLEQIQAALDAAEIDTQLYADVRSHWAGRTGLVASRVRPVATLLGASMDGFEAAAANADVLAEWIADRVARWEAPKLIAAARRSRDDHAMGLAAWSALGETAQLPAWNAALSRLGDEYEPVENKLADEQVAAHLEVMRPLLQALARNIAIESREPESFLRLELVTDDFKAPEGLSKRWWEVPFSAVVNALYRRYQDTVPEGHLGALKGVTSVHALRGNLKERGIGIDPDAYETARTNIDRLIKVLLNVHDLHRAWVEIRSPGSQLPTKPIAPDPGAEVYLRCWTDAELWSRALAGVDDEAFAAACGDSGDPSKIRDSLGLDEEAIAKKRRTRVQRDEEAARKQRQIEIAGRFFEIGTIDYAHLFREHITTLEEPTGPRAIDDEFTPLGRPRSRTRPNGGGVKKRKTTYSGPSPEEAELIGVIGEIHAYRYLRKQFGGRAIRARAWVSKSRIGVLPLVDGERDETSDGHGFDFRFNHDGVRWHIEVKATKEDESSFNLGISEIEAATTIARRRSNRWRWRILRIRNALSREPAFDWLPNPFEDGFRKHYRLHQGGMIVSYRRRRT